MRRANRFSVHYSKRTIPSIQSEDAVDSLMSSVVSDSILEEESEASVQMTPLYLFLASTLNVELVYIILTGITKFAKLKKDHEGSTFIDEDYFRIEENDKGSTLILDQIEIENADRWTVTNKVEDFV